MANLVKNRKASGEVVEVKAVETVEVKAQPTIEELMRQVQELTAQLGVTKKAAETAGGGRMLAVYNALVENMPCSTEKLAKLVGISTHNIGSQLTYLRQGKGLAYGIPIAKNSKGLHIIEKDEAGNVPAFVKKAKTG